MGKGKLIVLAVLFVVLIGGSLFMYNNLMVGGVESLTEESSTTTLEEETGERTTEEEAQEEVEEEPIKAVDFVVVNKDEEEVSLSDFYGKPIVVNFWASWCPPCKAEMPYFQFLYEELGDEVVFMMINSTDGSRETIETAQSYIDEEGYTFPVFFDTEFNASYTYGVSSLPSTLFIDSEGNILYGQLGGMTQPMLEERIALIYSPEE